MCVVESHPQHIKQTKMSPVQMGFTHIDGRSYNYKNE